MHINRLPCLVLRLIFSKLSFADVLQAGRVCLLWRECQLEITTKLKSITLLTGRESYYNNQPSSLNVIERSLFFIPHRDELQTSDGSPLFVPQLGPDWSRLCITNFDLSIVHSLIEALPNVTSLNVSINSSDSSVIDLLILLLTNWKHQLSTFKFWCHIFEINSQQIFDVPNSSSFMAAKNADQIHKLLGSLNSLVNLYHLTLDISHGGYNQAKKLFNKFINRDLNEEFVFLSRLSEFYFDFHNIEADFAFYRWFRVNGHSNTRLEHVGSNLMPNRVREIRNSQLAHKFTVVSRSPLIFPLFNDQSWEVLSQFTALTSLSVRLDLGQTFPEVVNKLATFKQLIYLKFAFYDGSFRMSDWDHIIPSRAIAQLSSVKILCINIRIAHHSHLESPHWAWIFPAVQLLSVDHECFCVNANSGRTADISSSTSCQHYEYWQRTGQLDKLSSEQVTEGIRDLLHTFKQCPALRRIYLNESKLAYQFTKRFKLML